MHQSNCDALLVSYVDKKKTGKKNVLPMVHTSASITKDQSVKPNVHTFYDHRKGEANMVDLVSTHNATKMKNRRWLNHLTLLHHRRSNSLTLWESY